MAVAAEVTGLPDGRSAVRQVAVTGASGFVGGALCRRLLASGISVRALVRHAQVRVPEGCDVHVVGDLAAGPIDWATALRDTDTVFHLAAVAQGDLQSVNVSSTDALARAAFGLGCRVVHVSSIKVYGDVRDEPLTERAPLGPSDDYGQSKLEGEQAIERAATELAGRWIALRPPIVYGPDERGNFARLIRLACSGLPLPFARVRNLRSMIHVDVLADALVRASCLDPAPNRSLVVAGGAALSTPEWLRAIANAACRPLHLWPLPTSWMLAGATLMGARGIAQRLLGSLDVDDAQWRHLAAWSPPITQDDAIASTVRAMAGRS